MFGYKKTKLVDFVKYFVKVLMSRMCYLPIPKKLAKPGA